MTTYVRFIHTGTSPSGLSAVRFATSGIEMAVCVRECVSGCALRLFMYGCCSLWVSVGFIQFACQQGNETAHWCGNLALPVYP